MSFSPLQITRIVCAKKIHILAHTNAYSRKYDPFSTNFSLLYYESVNSPFLLWKFYLDVLSRLIFNVSCRNIIPILLSDLNTDRRRYTVCTVKNCCGLKTAKIKTTFCKHLVFFTKRICEISCQFFDPVSIDDTFQNYEWANFFSSYIDIKRWIVFADASG